MNKLFSNLKSKNYLIYSIGFVVSIIEDLRTLGKGSTYVGPDEELVEITDSKVLTKRRKDLRNSIGQILENNSKETNRKLNRFKADNKDQPRFSVIGIDFIEFFVPILARNAGDFVEGITGSNRYKRIVSLFITVITTETFLNYLREEDYKLENVSPSKVSTEQGDTNVPLAKAKPEAKPIKSRVK